MLQTVVHRLVNSGWDLKGSLVLERLVIKTWVYTFALMLVLCIIFVPASYHSSLTGQTYIVPLRQYIFDLLRTSLSVSLVVTVFVAIIRLIKRPVVKERISKLNVNKWSFVAALACVLLFAWAGSGRRLTALNAMGIRLNYFVLFAALSILLLGIVGLQDIRGKRDALRSWTTIIIASILSAIAFVWVSIDAVFTAF